MSNYHVLGTINRERFARVAFHVTVQDETNLASRNYRDIVALVKDPFTSSVLYLPTEFSAELTSLQNGLLWEHVESVWLGNINDTLVQKRAKINAR